MSKPVAIDLFCGKGGWTNALLEAGFEVYGFDIEPQPNYRGIFIQCDILELPAAQLRDLQPSFGTCSPASGPAAALANSSRCMA